MTSSSSLPAFSAISISLLVLTILLIATELIAAAYFYISAQHAFRFRLSCDQHVKGSVNSKFWPNLVDFASGNAINTHPLLVLAAAESFRRMGAKYVIVAEGPGHQRDTQLVL